MTELENKAIKEVAKELQEENERLKKIIEDSKKDGISPVNYLIIKNLIEQIEKMKCCENCCYRGQINNCTYKYYSRCAYECKDYSLWEFKE